MSWCRSETEWHLHVKVQHLRLSQPYRCLICRAAFSSDDELQAHVSSHKKAFACRLCSEAFHVEFLLDKHMQERHVTTSDVFKQRVTASDVYSRQLDQIAPLNRSLSGEDLLRFHTDVMTSMTSWMASPNRGGMRYMYNKWLQTHASIAYSFCTFRLLAHRF